MHGRRRGSPTANLARSVSNILQNNPQFVSRLLITIQYFTNTPLILDGLLNLFSVVGVFHALAPVLRLPSAVVLPFPTF